MRLFLPRQDAVVQENPVAAGKAGSALRNRTRQDAGPRGNPVAARKAGSALRNGTRQDATLRGNPVAAGEAGSALRNGTRQDATLRGNPVAARKAGSALRNGTRQDATLRGNPVAAEILDEMATAGKVQPTRSCSRNTPARAPYLNRAKKSLPLSSTRMKAGKSSTRIFQMASMPSSGYSTHSMLLMLFWARMAAGPPIEPR